MIFVLLVLLLVIFNRLEFAEEGKFFQNEYLNRNTTAAINGIFVVLVIFSHYAQYAHFEGVYDEPYLLLQKHLNQMIVATFLFYSGYGMMESFKRKGVQYLKRIPTKFITLLLKFDCAVCVFWILGKILGLQHDYGIKTVLYSFIAWLNLGNSNWYIFVILAEYVLLWIAFQGIRYRDSRAMYYLSSVLFFFFTIGLIVFLIKKGQAMYWYDTAILLPVGIWYSLGKEKIEKIVMKNDYLFLFWCVLSCGIYVVLYFHRFKYGVGGYSLWAISFIVLVLLITMKVKIGNSLLDWFGKHVFSIYILQRIPMITLDYFGCIESHRYISLIIVIVTTALMAVVFDYMTDKVTGCITK